MSPTTDTIVPVAPIEVAQREQPRPPAQREVVFDVRNLDVFYGKSPAVKGVNLAIYQNMVTALIGPSGCGKSTFIRCLNRMHEVVAGATTKGKVLLDK